MVSELPEDIKKALEQRLKDETEKLEKLMEERSTLNSKIKPVRELVVSLEYILQSSEK